MANRGLDIDSGRWWSHSWSVIEGCTKRSPGCAHCWLSSMERFKGKKGTPTYKAGFDGTVVTRFDRLFDPLIAKDKRIYMVLSDLFHESVPTQFIHSAFTVMAMAEKHVFVVLTKRPERIKETLYGEEPFFDMLSDRTHLRNVYLGTSIENQDVLKSRLLPLISVPGRRIISFEPLLSEIDIPGELLAAMDGSIDGVIVGGETGSAARRMEGTWVYHLLEQCSSIGLPFFFKSWGSKDKALGRKLHYRVWNSLPWTPKAPKSGGAE